MTPPRIVVGAGRPNRLSALVCEFTIKKHCPQAEVIHTWQTPFIPGVNNREHRDRWEDPCEWLKTMHPLGTMFSFCRHMVPEICGHEGQAIYIDSDTLLFSSIEQLWSLDMQEAKIVGVKGCHQYSVLKMDCAAFKDYPIRRLLTGGWTYSQLLKGTYLPPNYFKRLIPGGWNCLDRALSGMKLLHYTRMPTQPWAVPGHPHGALWFDALAEAVIAGAIPMEVVEKEVRKQDIKQTWPAAVYPQPHVLQELQGRL